MVDVKQVFPNVSTYLDFVESPVNSSLSRSSQRERASDSWDKSVGWQGAVDLAERGWPEGLAEVDKFTSKLTTVLSGMIKLPELQYGVEGQFGDIGRALEGDPEFMVSIVDSDVRVDARPAKIVRLVCNLSVSGSQDSSVLISRGAAMAALVIMLERHGIRAEIDLCAVSGSWGAGGTTETWVRVKESDEPLHLNNLIFHLAHPASLRRLVFSAWEHLDDARRQASGFIDGRGYGSPKQTEDQGDIYLGRISSASDWGEQRAVAWIIGQLEAQGIELSHD